jgi:HK97 gp10 family phage protein
MAANSISVKLDGLPGLRNKLLLLVPKIRTAVQATIAETALLIETDAKLLSAVDTGLNRAEIHAEIAPNGLAAKVFAGTEYAIYLEFGTRFQRAQPFLFPAYEKNRGRFVERLKANTKLF